MGMESVAIVVSSPHRKSALQAVDFLIDELKRTVPIWKKVTIFCDFILADIIWLIGRSATATGRRSGKKM